VDETVGRSGGWGFPAKVVSSRLVTPTVHAIQVEKPKAFSFRPTQFTFLLLRTDEGMDARPMSLATSPTRPHLEYAVRLSDSPFKRAFAALRPGDDVVVRGPIGDFILEETRPAVLLAGGIGITPLKGMVEYATDRALPIAMRLVYSNRDEDEIAYGRELAALRNKNPSFRVLHTLTRAPGGSWKGSTGRIGQGLLREAAQGLTRPVYYVCGAPGFVVAMVRLLTDLRVPNPDLRWEAFRGYG